jgi:hypothetical protein
MCAALTTAAVINHSMSPPEKGVSWIDFAPHHNRFIQRERADSSDELTDAQRKMIHDHEVRALDLAAQMRQADEHAR